jgi:hypothetical protein
VITVLALGDRERALALDAAAARNPSIELLHAGNVEEALDRLARNRRIDAVLLIVGGDQAREIAGILLEEDPAGPPIFAAGDEIAGVSMLPPGTAEELLGSIVSRLSS